jgi:hypothetical protein
MDELDELLTSELRAQQGLVDAVQSAALTNVRNCAKSESQSAYANVLAKVVAVSTHTSPRLASRRVASLCLRVAECVFPALR